MKSLHTRFWNNVTRGHPEACWFWQASRFEGGYGQIKNQGKNEHAHRVAYRLHHGPIPPGMMVLHACGTPACCNPNHLYLGSHQDNMNDKVRHGRSLAGERNPRATITTRDVQIIRLLRNQIGLTKDEIANRYGIGPTQVFRIAQRQQWESVPNIDLTQEGRDL